MKKHTNYNAVDVMKFISSILVVSIHVPPLLSYSETANFILVDIIARIAVPFFFVCAGFFFFTKVEMVDGKIGKNILNLMLFKKYIIQLVKIYTFWTVFYLIWWIPSWYHGGFLTLSNIKGYILSIFISGSYYHLWYIVSLIYGMVFLFTILRYVQVKWVIGIAVIFYLIGTFAYSYTWIISENYIIKQLIQVYEFLGSFSVGLFRAFPYLLMGLVFTKYKIKIKISLSTILSVFCLILIGLEVWLLKSYENTSRFSYVLLTGFTIFFIFNTVSKIKLKSNKFYPLLRKISTIIYFVHPMFININGLILLRYFSNDNSLILFCSVLACVMMFSVGLIKFSQLKQFKILKSVY